MSKHIGIVACSAEGAALCYRTICLEAAELMGKHTHPEITMHTHPFNEYMGPIEGGNWDVVAELMLTSAEKLAAAGVDFAICPDNTIHQAFDRFIQKSPIPWLHIAQVVASEAQRQGYHRLGILGTRWLMSGPVYSAKLTEMGIDREIPEEIERERIHQIIFDELVNGLFTESSLAYLVEVIHGLKEQGCDAVVLGCTEIPLLVAPEDSPLPTLDSTRLLARAALNKAIGIDPS
jgi:aspartate racemase